MDKANIGRQIKLPFRDAVKISVNSLVIRFGRAAITSSGIFLGIAFLTSTLTNFSLSAVLQDEPDPDIVVKQIWLIGISLVVSVLGITNSMLMSVTERYKEIGTMKCLGALDKFIVKIFILEAFFQGLIGSLGGAVLGTLSMTAMFVFEKGFKIFDVYPLTKILTYNMVAVTIGLAISIIGAVYPAYRAAKMEPIEAMRREV